MSVSEIPVPLKEWDDADREACQDRVASFDDVRSMSFYQAGELHFAIGCEGALDPAIVSDTWTQVGR